ncbi:CDP-alcohol phosphatidyltransferase family protein [Actinotalea ferrariae]|uniref:CDP-alcohol phosphatidyltransferase family protein n=1 Tax=Actinotalea ferrariae TaxID=1386098 RepID=UPI001C8B6456|nr:CDP-alcohol phosphatidyltransferase family protein [Actinotalea ferrariae]MBX9244945.1 CDP-alcohol phosphatidyltransferase family protein [Actinotalea ferrariae]
MSVSNAERARPARRGRPVAVADAAAPSTSRDESYRDVVRRLASAQKAAAPGAPAYSVLVNRPFGRLLAAWAFRRGLTPDAVTAISAMFTFSGIALVAVVGPGVWTAALVPALLVVGYAFDSADGQVARLRGGGSVAGEWLDHVVDAIKISTLHLAVLVMAYRFLDLPSEALLLVPVGFTVVAAVSFFAMILNEQLKRGVAARSGAATLPPARVPLVRRLLVLPTDYGVLCLVFVLLAAPMAFFWAYTLLFVGCAGHLVLALLKWRRDMVRLAAEAAVARG